MRINDAVYDAIQKAREVFNAEKFGDEPRVVEIAQQFAETADTYISAKGNVARWILSKVRDDIKTEILDNEKLTDSRPEIFLPAKCAEAALLAGLLAQYSNDQLEIRKVIEAACYSYEQAINLN